MRRRKQQPEVRVVLRQYGGQYHMDVTHVGDTEALITLDIDVPGFRLEDGAGHGRVIVSGGHR